MLTTVRTEATCTTCTHAFDPERSSAHGFARFCCWGCEWEYWHQQGRERGAGDRLLGEESALARGSILPGYAEGYQEGREGS